MCKSESRSGVRIFFSPLLNRNFAGGFLSNCIDENFVSENRVKVISIELIQQATAEYFKIKPDDIKRQKRTATIAYPRQIAMYLCRELTDATYEKIGEEFGKRHYSTVMHAFNEITERAASNKATAKQIKELTESIRKL